jgi:hypothetical protein
MHLAPRALLRKHKTTGMKVQVACTIHGQLAWISDPVDRSRHHNYGLGESGVPLTLDPKNWVGDKGYIGNGLIMPFRKPAGGHPGVSQYRLYAQRCTDHPVRRDTRRLPLRPSF